MSLFEQEILVNDIGIYTMHIIWCKKVDTRYGFKAYGEDLKTKWMHKCCWGRM